VQEHDLPVLAEGVGAEDPLLLGTFRAHGVELAVQEQVEDLELAEVPRAPGVELRLEHLGGAARAALRDAPAKDLGVEALDVARREPTDVAAADQGTQFGGHALQRVGQRERDRGGGVAHLRRPEVQDPGLGLQGVVAVPVPVAGELPRGPLVVAAAEDGGHHVLQPNLEQQLGRPPDELPERVAGEPGGEVGTKGFLHLGARWSPFHGVGAPFSVRGGRAGVATGRIPYAFSCLHRG